MHQNPFSVFFHGCVAKCSQHSASEMEIIGTIQQASCVGQNTPHETILLDQLFFRFLMGIGITNTGNQWKYTHQNQ
jgi:hypothetical protein